MRSSALLTAGIVLLSSLSATTAAAAPEPPKPQPAPAADTNSTDPAKREELLGKGWQQSGDRAWTTSGDANGFHVLVADAATGYTWRTAATLSETGFDADQWIGNACVTESGKRAVVVYAPRIFTNKEKYSGRGGFSALVDLDTGAVTKLPIRSSLAYFNPGCGTGESAVLTQEGDGAVKTGLTKLDATTAKLDQRIETEGQLTSAVPTKTGIIAAARDSLVKIDQKGGRTRVAAATGTPFLLKPDGEGGVVFLERLGDEVRARRALPGDPKAKLTTLATGALKDLSIASGKAGKVFITGKAKSVGALPASVAKVDVARDATVSTEGTTAVEKSVFKDKPSEFEEARRASVELKVLRTGKNISFTVDPAEVVSDQAATGRAVHPKLGGAVVQQQLTVAAADLSNPVDAERTCSIPRGDVAQMATQPTPLQAEWAADRAVLGTLEETDGAQKMFPSIPIEGGGKVPPQILLGIMAQESNLWQSARFAIPGVSANPLIGNYFGVPIYNKDGSDDWDIHWDKADCGYGITQVTDGMRMAGREGTHGPALPENQQRAIALDHKTNIAKGLNILQNKWNETRRAGLIVNNGNSRKIENWFFAVWAYNSGFNANKGDGQPWGVGWTNNPINPRYQANRNPFLEYCQCDAKNPQFWPYPEKIMGWAAHSIGTPYGENGAGFLGAWWNTTEERAAVKPPADLFCKPQNDCYPGQKWTPDDPSVLPGPGDDPEPAGPCAHKNPANGKYDLKCWWRFPATWKSDCDSTCGNWNFRYDVEPSPGWGTNYKPQCTQAKLPANALIIDDLPATPAPLPAKWADPVRRCTRDWQSRGTFKLDFATPSAKIDFHQIGAGFDNHFWFAHTHRNEPSAAFAKVTGTWTLNQALTGWARVMVHIPDHGAHTRQASYEIETGSTTKTRTLLQRTEENKWVSLGVFQFSGVPKVRLSTTTRDGNGSEDVAWDAIAFQPMAQKPANMIVSLGDSYASGEGAGGNESYYRETNVDGNVTATRNACHRSPHSWSRQGKLAMHSGNTIGQIADFYNDPTTDYHLLACSGARARHVLPSNGVNGQPPPKDAWGRGSAEMYSDLSQLDRGFVDENTTLVTMSIGGNDARFTDILKACIGGGLKDCPNEFLAEDNGRPLKEAEPDVIKNKVKPSAATVLRTIHQLAPNAKIVLMGYPKLMEDMQDCWVSFTSKSITWLNEMADLMANEFSNLAQTLRTEGIQIAFGNPISKFNGKGACAFSDPMINFIIPLHTDGDTPLSNGGLLSAESLHPNRRGHALYGEVFTEALRTLQL